LKEYFYFPWLGVEDYLTVAGGVYLVQYVNFESKQQEIQRDLALKICNNT